MAGTYRYILGGALSKKGGALNKKGGAHNNPLLIHAYISQWMIAARRDRAECMRHVSAVTPGHDMKLATLGMIGGGAIIEI
jgi:hypothetical protein